MSKPVSQTTRFMRLDRRMRTHRTGGLTGAIGYMRVRLWIALVGQRCMVDGRRCPPDVRNLCYVFECERHAGS